MHTLFTLAILFKLSVVAPPISIVVAGGAQPTPADVEIMLLIPGHEENREWQVTVREAKGGGWSASRKHVGQFAQVSVSLPYPRVLAGYYTVNATLTRVVRDKEGVVTGTRTFHALPKSFVIYTKGAQP